MAYQIQGETVTLQFGSTGIPGPYRFVDVSTAAATQGQLILPSSGERVLGVLISSGTTGSTDASGKYGTVQISGIAKVVSRAGTFAAGDAVTADSSGMADTRGTGDYGYMVVSGSSGSTGRILSVSLMPLGSTVA